MWTSSPGRGQAPCPLTVRGWRVERVPNSHIDLQARRITDVIVSPTPPRAGIAHDALFEVSRLADCVQIFVAAQEDLVVHERRGRVESVIQRVLRQHFERRPGLDDYGRAFTAREVDASLCGDRRGEDIRHTVEPLILIMRLAGPGI